MNRRDFTLALGSGAAASAASGAGLAELGAVAGGVPAAAVELGEQRLHILLLLREMSQQTLYTLEANRKAIIEQIAKLDAEIEREMQK